MWLSKGNDLFKENATLLIPREMKMDTLDNMAHSVFSYKANPNNQEMESVASALTEKHPCLIACLFSKLHLA